MVFSPAVPHAPGGLSVSHVNGIVIFVPLNRPAVTVPAYLAPSPDGVARNWIMDVPEADLQVILAVVTPFAWSATVQLLRMYFPIPVRLPPLTPLPQPPSVPLQWAAPLTRVRAVLLRHSRRERERSRVGLQTVPAAAPAVAIGSTSDETSADANSTAILKSILYVLTVHYGERITSINRK